MTALLSVAGLSVRFGDSTVVSDVSFDVQPGECVGIVGESGSGKSVTARSETVSSALTTRVPSAGWLGRAAWWQPR